MASIDMAAARERRRIRELRNLDAYGNPAEPAPPWVGRSCGDCSHWVDDGGGLGVCMLRARSELILGTHDALDGARWAVAHLGGQDRDACHAFREG